VVLIAVQPLVLVVNKEFTADSLNSFTDCVKANAAKLSFGSGCSGSAALLGCVLLNTAIGVNVQHVPYRVIMPQIVKQIGILTGSALIQKLRQIVPRPVDGKASHVAPKFRKQFICEIDGTALCHALATATFYFSNPNVFGDEAFYVCALPFHIFNE